MPAAVGVQNPQCKLVALCTMQDTPLFLSSSASPLLLLGLQLPDCLSTRKWFVDLRNHQRPLAVLLLLVHSVGEETGIRLGVQYSLHLIFIQFIFPGGRGYVATRTLAGAFLCNVEPTAASRGPDQHRAPRRSYPGPPGIPSAGNGVQS